MKKLRSKEHLTRAVIYLSLGVLCATIPALGLYLDTTRERLLLWILLYFATLPAVGWGASHLAQSRGYPSAGGCGLCIVGYLISGFLGTTSPHPFALGIGMVFIVLLPTTVLLALPNKSEGARRKRH